jgi:hypothetical protein
MGHGWRGSSRRVIAVYQLADARQLRVEQAQPYVAVSMGSDPGQPQFVDLVIKNYGATADEQRRTGRPRCARAA